MKMVIFTLTSARSGTLYLRSLFKHNVVGCVARHEPFFDWGNPTLFGRAIYDAGAGRRDRIRALLARKRAYIDRLNAQVYLESSHAFLKSAYVAALEFFPDMRLIRLIRDPLRVAKSEAFRQTWRQRLHVPFHFYRGDDDRRHFAWALTGNEEIYRGFAADELSPFQWSLLQWIEIENRATRFLKDNQLHDRCVTLHATRDLNDPAKIENLFRAFGLNTLHSEIVLRGRKNKSIGGKTMVTPRDEDDADAVLERLPAKYLEIFSHPPYTGYGWSARLRRSAAAGGLAVASGGGLPEERDIAPTQP